MTDKIDKRLLVKLGLMCLPLLLIFGYRLESAYRYDSDFARDLVDMLQISRGDLRLVGPKLSFGGIYAGPYYYYVFVLALAWAKQPEHLLIANTIIFWLGMVAAGYVLVKRLRFGQGPVILGLYWLGTSNFWIYSARGPGNAFSYLPLMLVLLILAASKLNKGKIFWLIYGFLWGVILNTHLITVLVMLPLMGMMWVRQQRDRRHKVAWGWAGAGGLLAYLPLILFELRHGFVMFTNTFIHKSYLAFVENTNLPNPLMSAKDPLTNLGLMVGHFNAWLAVPFGVILVILAGRLVLGTGQGRNGGRYLAAVALISFGLLVVVARSQLAVHYFFPFLLASSVAVMMMGLEHKKGGLILGLLLILNGLNLPQHYYAPTPRPISEFRRVTNEIVADEELGTNLEPQRFNVFVVRETPLAVSGHEYRYFLDLNGLKPLAIDSYAQAEKLLIIQEPGADQPEDVRSWELSEFGPKELIVEKAIGSRRVYVYEKE